MKDDFYKSEKRSINKKKTPAITAIDRKFYLPARYAISFHMVYWEKRILS